MEFSKNGGRPSQQPLPKAGRPAINGILSAANIRNYEIWQILIAGIARRRPRLNRHQILTEVVTAAPDQLAVGRLAESCSPSSVGESELAVACAGPARRSRSATEPACGSLEFPGIRPALISPVTDITVQIDSAFDHRRERSRKRRKPRSFNGICLTVPTKAQTHLQVVNNTSVRELQSARTR